MKTDFVDSSQNCWLLERERGKGGEGEGKNLLAHRKCEEELGTSSNRVPMNHCKPARRPAGVVRGWVPDSCRTGAGVGAFLRPGAADLSFVSRRQGPGGGGPRQPHGPAALRLHRRVPLEPGLRVLPPQRRVRARLRRPAPLYGCRTRAPAATTARATRAKRAPGSFNDRVTKAPGAGGTEEQEGGGRRCFDLPGAVGAGNLGMNAQLGFPKENVNSHCGTQGPPSVKLEDPHVGTNRIAQG